MASEIPTAISTHQYGRLTRLAASLPLGLFSQRLVGNNIKRASAIALRPNFRFRHSPIQARRNRRRPRNNVTVD